MAYFRFSAVLISLALAACVFGLDRRGGVLKYDNGRVLTARGGFVVPKMPRPWKSPRILFKQLVHDNDAIGATIVTDALCGAKFDDAPLRQLAAEMFRKLEDPRLDPGKKRRVAGTEGLEVHGAGMLDGAPVAMNVVVMKRDLCLYDFVYFASQVAFEAGRKDFEDYLDGIEIQ